MKLSDLRKAYNVLVDLDVEVPHTLLVHLADLIREQEGRNLTRRMNRMSEEDIILFQSKQKRTLRINTGDGRLIQKRTNEDTFRTALLELDLERVGALNIMVHGKPLIVSDLSLRRKRLRGYWPVKDGYFLLAKSTADEKLRVLQQIDEHLQLDWDILLL